MDMLYSDYIDMINGLMMQVMLHNCGADDYSEEELEEIYSQYADPDVLDNYFEEYFGEDDVILIDEA